MAKRITTTITLSPEAHAMLTEVAIQQMRSRSHAIEQLIRETYDRNSKANHKAITIEGV